MTTPTLGDLTQIPVTKIPTQGLPPLGDTNVTLYNQDITNLVWVSYNQWFTAGAGNSVPIQPLTSITISAKRAIYVASTVAGVANLLVLPEGSQAQPSPAQMALQIATLGLAKDTSVNNPSFGPATLAQQVTQQTAIPGNIAATGVPLLALPTSITNTSNTSVASGTTTVLGPFSFNQIGYEITVSVHSAAATATYCRVLMTWSDSVSGTTLDRQSWWIIPGADATTNEHTIKGFGPTEGNQVTISLQAFNNTVVFDQVIMNQNSRVFARHDWRTYAAANFAGAIAAGPMDMSAMILMCNNVSLATGTHTTTYTGLFAGKVEIWFHSSSSTTDGLLQLIAISDQTAGINQNMLNLETGSQGDVNCQFYVPRCCLQVIATNNNAATKTLTYAIVMTDN